MDAVMARHCTAEGGGEVRAWRNSDCGPADAFAVPVPMTGAVLAIGAVGLGLRRRTR
jgi:hypothetical protein